MKTKELCVPIAALEVEGQRPEAGDPVSFQIEGRFVRADGDKAYIEATTANGLEMPDAESKPATPEDEEAALTKRAAEADGMAGDIS